MIELANEMLSIKYDCSGASKRATRSQLDKPHNVTKPFATATLFSMRYVKQREGSNALKFHCNVTRNSKSLFKFFASEILFQQARNE